MGSSQENIQIQDTRDFWWVCVDISVLRDSRLSVYAKAVYAILCTYASTQGRECFPSVALIADSASISERTAQRALAQLAQFGYVERRKRFKAGAQISSLYKIIGHKAALGGDCVTPPRRQPDTPPVTDSHPELEPDEPDNNTLPTVMGADAPEAVDAEIASAPHKDAALIERVPQAMRATAEYLLYKTGRKGLLSTELGSFMALEKIHLPARIQQEINTAAKRFSARSRPLSGITADYIYESLRHQNSKNWAAAQKSAVAQLHERTAEELEYEQRMFEKFGGGACDARK